MLTYDLRACATIGIMLAVHIGDLLEADLAAARPPRKRRAPRALGTAEHMMSAMSASVFPAASFRPPASNAPPSNFPDASRRRRGRAERSGPGRKTPPKQSAPG
eukprot:9467942-Pyramimonas_sp.AAC.1